MKIQSIFTAAGILAIAMTSCSTDETVMKPETQVGQIIFHVATPNVTRAANTFSNAVKPKRFKVYAFDQGEIYFGPDLMSSSDNGVSWTSEEPRYWPKNKAEGWTGLDFYAFVDDTDIDYSGETAGDPATGTFDNSEKKFKDFEVESDVAKQRDLMYAVSKKVKPGSNNGSVKLEFNHALSQICFTAKNVDPNHTMVINKITVGGVYSKGTFDIETGKWTISEESTTTSYTITKEVTLEALSSENENQEPTNISKPVGEGLSLAMNLIPQKQNMASDSESLDGAYFIVNMTIDDETSDYFIPVDIDWKSGKRYIYNLRLESGMRILYDVTVNDITVEEKEIVDGHENLGHDAVLMRPADPEKGIKALYFATCNLGAKTPFENGLYYRFGETDGWTPGTDVPEFTFDKETMLEDENEEISSLKPEYDAANKAWGGKWRMPTKEELEWLGNIGDQDNCVWTKYEDSGYYVESKATGNKIFLPFSGNYNAITGTPTAPTKYLTKECIYSTEDKEFKGYMLVFRLTEDNRYIIPYSVLAIFAAIRPVYTED